MQEYMDESEYHVVQQMLDQQQSEHLVRPTLESKLVQLAQGEPGSLYVWGSGKDGRCGNMSEEGFQEPTEVQIFDDKTGEEVKFV